MEKVYVGSAKAGNGQFGGYLKVSFNQPDIEMMQRFMNSRGYVNLFISKRKDVGKFGDTHSITIAAPRDDYNPQNPSENPYAQAIANSSTSDTGNTQTVNPFNGRNNGIENAMADDYGMKPIDPDTGDVIPF